MSVRDLLSIRSGQRDNVAIATFVLLAFSLLFGGASRLHELRLALVELIALPLFAMATLVLLRRSPDPAHKYILTIAALVAAVPLLQLVPLPPAIWSGLPGRDQVVLALDVLNEPEPWLPITLTPDKTWRSFLALIPPLGMLLGILALNRHGTVRQIILMLLAFILLSILLGAAQFISGGEKLYPWPTTDAGEVTGFFANRNHLATLCLVGIPFATVLGAGALRRHSADARLHLWVAVLFIALSVVALGIIRSRAGIIIFGPVITACLIAAWVAAGRGRPKPLLLLIAGGAALAIAAVGAFAAGPILERFDTNGAREGRFENWPIVASAAENFLPLGSGLGSFDSVFRSVEPLEDLDATYFNQAHNDYLETWLETGWIGAGLLIAFLVWFGRRSWAAWTSSASSARDLQRAASIGIGAILLHSGADYPLRTVAIATVFALCCGILELSVRSDSELAPERSGRRRTRSD